MAKEVTKSGVKTSEFYVTLAGTLTTVLIGLGVLAPETAEELKTQANQLGELIVALVPVVSSIVYTIARVVIKTRTK
jgi:hypothetical protein